MTTPSGHLSGKIRKRIDTFIPWNGLTCIDVDIAENVAKHFSNQFKINNNYYSNKTDLMVSTLNNYFTNPVNTTLQLADSTKIIKILKE